MPSFCSIRAPPTTQSTRPRTLPRPWMSPSRSLKSRLSTLAFRGHERIVWQPIMFRRNSAGLWTQRRLSFWTRMLKSLTFTILRWATSTNSPVWSPRRSRHSRLFWRIVGPRAYSRLMCCRTHPRGEWALSEWIILGNARMHATSIGTAPSKIRARMHPGKSLRSRRGATSPPSCNAKSTFCAKISRCTRIARLATCFTTVEPWIASTTRTLHSRFSKSAVRSQSGTKNATRPSSSSAVFGLFDMKRIARPRTTTQKRSRTLPLRMTVSVLSM